MFKSHDTAAGRGREGVLCKPAFSLSKLSKFRKIQKRLFKNTSNTEPIKALFINIILNQTGGIQ